MTTNVGIKTTATINFDWEQFLKSVKDVTSLDLSKQAITEIPNEFFDLCSNLQYLYLEGNKLSELNNKLFSTLRKLKWLDVRNNSLSNIPNTIIDHPSLQVLLLEGNKIETLPIEMGSLENLRGIQLARNPITYPPPHVVSEGVESTIDFLRRQWQQCQSPENIQLISESHYQPNSAENPANLSKKHKSIRSQSTTRIKTKYTHSRRRKSQIGNNATNLTTCISVRPISNSFHRHQTRDSLAVEGWPLSDKIYSAVNYENGDVTQYKKNKFNYKNQRQDLKDEVPSKQVRDIWIEKIRNMLIAQETILQRRRNQEAMQQWQDEAKAQEKTYSKKELTGTINFPYDTDPGYLKMRSRQDIAPTVAERRRDSSLHHVRHEEPINSKIISIMEALQDLQKSQNGELASPRSEQRILSQEIGKIKEIQRSLNALKLKNFGQISLPF